MVGLPTSLLVLQDVVAGADLRDVSFEVYDSFCLGLLVEVDVSEEAGIPLSLLVQHFL